MGEGRGGTGRDGEGRGGGRGARAGGRGPTTPEGVAIAPMRIYVAPRAGPYNS